MSTEEKLKQAKGSVKEGIGRLTGDQKTEKEGAAEKAVSKIREITADAKEALEGAIDGVKNSLKKED